MYNKIFYKRYHKKPIDDAMAGVTLSENNNDREVQEEEDLTEEEELEYKLYFRQCIVAREKPILKIKLQKSIKLREKMMKQKGVEFYEIFPFYFIDPDFVRKTSLMMNFRIFFTKKLNDFFCK